VTPGSRPPRETSCDRVLAILRRSEEPLGVAALTAAACLSPNAVRFHLQRLVERGAVRAATDVDHEGPGRPAILYSALPAEASEAGAAYRLIAGLLASELSRSAPATAALDAGRDWARSLDLHATDSSPDEAIGAVRNLFERTGFAPTIRADELTVELHRCPFFDLAAQQPEVVCSIHLGLVTELLEQLGSTAKVRLVPVLDGSGPCLVRLGDRSAKPPKPVSATAM
jgi:predicted ArsR family transcriptional regulator